MTKLNCEYVRDIYPDALHGRMDPELAQRVREHVALCDDCAAECALVAAIYHHQTPLPAGLPERVITAATQPRRRALIRPAHLAMAATLAAALIGGAILIDTQQPLPGQQKQPTARRGVLHVGAVGVDATMMTGKTSLDDLSVEQLEKLLGEMES